MSIPTLSFSLEGGPQAQRLTSPRPPNGAKRSHAMALNDVSDNEADANTGAETITHFAQATGGGFDASRPKEVKGPLIIQPQSNRRWQDAHKQASRQKRSKHALPPPPDGERDTAALEAAEAVVNARKPKHGLNIVKPNGIESTSQDMAESQSLASVPVPERKQDSVPKTDDERAMDALLGNKTQSTLVLPAVTEEEAFQRDYRDAPDMATLEEYTAVPVEEFGAALLRGMGWKEGMGIGNQKSNKTEKSKMAERRPALLGIGAKADAAVAAELGTWGHADKGRRRPETMYNPIVMRNRRTGEEMSEAELQQKLQSQKDTVARSSDKDTHRHEERRGRGDSDEEYERRKSEKRRRERDDRRSPRRDTSHERDRHYRQTRRQDDSDRDRRSRRPDGRDKETRRDRDRDDRNDRDRHGSRRDRR